LRIDVETGEVEDISAGRGLQLVAPNYLAFAPDGTLYFTDSGNWGDDDGRLLALPPSNGPAQIIAEGLAFANGIALGATGDTLFVVESSTPGVSEVSLSGSDRGKRSRIIEMPETVPDGIAVCRDGSLVIACYRPDTVYGWSSESGLSVIASDFTGLSLSAPTNVVFAGKTRDRLVTANLAGYHLTEVIDAGRQGLWMEFTF